MGKVKDSKLTILSLAPPILTRREFLKSSAVSCFCYFSKCFVHQPRLGSGDQPSSLCHDSG